MATAHVLIRVWLPDRPGALGQVASRIGSVRGDIVGVDVLECDGGVAIDEFLAEWAALIVDVGPDEGHVDGNGAMTGSGGHNATVAAIAGDAPGADHLEALALGVAASPLVASGAAGPEDLAAAPLAAHRAV